MRMYVPHYRGLVRQYAGGGDSGGGMVFIDSPLSLMLVLWSQIHIYMLVLVVTQLH